MIEWVGLKVTSLKTLRVEPTPMLARLHNSLGGMNSVVKGLRVEHTHACKTT